MPETMAATVATMVARLVKRARMARGMMLDCQLPM